MFGVYTSFRFLRFYAMYAIFQPQSNEWGFFPIYVIKNIQPVQEIHVFTFNFVQFRTIIEA